jgi:pimeloyl-ACP methyl ester carboxylesterase
MNTTQEDLMTTTTTMSTWSTALISHAVRAAVAAFWLLASAALTACGPELSPTLASVSGRTVEVVEAGTGALTVVFESGLGDDWTPWELVAAQVARDRRVFAYSRPGYGKSASSQSPRTAAVIAEELRTLLAIRGIAPPYVLVGHSFGGAYMELFAKAHPDEVAGVVLVDPRHRDFTSACENSGISACTIPEAVLTSLPEVQRAEVDGFASASNEIRAAGTFGKYPVRVLTATSHASGREFEALWKSMLGSLAAEASDGKQVILPGAGHYLQLERPIEVVQAILEIGAR